MNMLRSDIRFKSETGRKMTMSNHVIEVRNLNKRYGHVQALKHVNLTVPRGQIYGLVGKNGAGKTTLMRVLTNQTFADQGEVALFGAHTEHDINKMRRRVGTIIEIPSFYAFMTARENLEFYRRQRGIAGSDCVDEALATVELLDAGNKKFKNFSLGMKQRMGLALAIMNHPDMLILDEPVNGLDPEGIVQFRNILLKLNREQQVTILISSHILAELQNLATHYTFMHNGAIVQDVSEKELSAMCQEHLEIVVDEPEKAATLLEQLAGCVSYEVLPGNMIRIYEMLDEPDVIAQILIENHIRLYSLKQNRMNLEDYFIDLVGGGKNA